jgi:hypothetical protein
LSASCLVVCLVTGQTHWWIHNAALPALLCDTKLPTHWRAPSASRRCKSSFRQNPPSNHPIIYLNHLLSVSCSSPKHDTETRPSPELCEYLSLAL